jgi:acetyltransferase (GNAT) family protein
MRKSTNRYYNRLIAWGQASPGTPQQLDRFLAGAREHRVGSVGVSLGPSARPAALRSWLDERGFAPVGPAAKLWRDASPLLGQGPGMRSSGMRGPGRGISVRVARGTDVARWVDVVSSVWRSFGSRRAWFEARAGAPGWRHYLAWIDGRPVATGALFVAEVSGRMVGHLVDGTTLRDHRGLGVQNALIRRRLTDGRRLGCEFFAVETAPPLPRMPLVSFRNLCRQGFQLAYVRESWRLMLR